MSLNRQNYDKLVDLVSPSPGEKRTIAPGSVNEVEARVILAIEEMKEQFHVDDSAITASLTLMQSLDKYPIAQNISYWRLQHDKEIRSKMVAEVSAQKVYGIGHLKDGVRQDFLERIYWVAMVRWQEKVQNREQPVEMVVARKIADELRSLEEDTFSQEIFEKVKDVWGDTPSSQWPDISEVAIMKAIVMIGIMAGKRISDGEIISMTKDNSMSIREQVYTLLTQKIDCKTIDLKDCKTLNDVPDGLLDSKNITLVMANSPGGEVYGGMLSAKTSWSDLPIDLTGKLPTYSSCACLIIGKGKDLYLLDLVEGTVRKVTKSNVKDFGPIVAVDLGK